MANLDPRAYYLFFYSLMSVNKDQKTNIEVKGTRNEFECLSYFIKKHGYKKMFLK